ncbi:LOW QUALITY PROTEIN: all-trans-retinol dehydrogenase [NAD(+)] ADH4-like [Trichechus inunguis]
MGLDVAHTKIDTNPDFKSGGKQLSYFYSIFQVIKCKAAVLWDLKKPFSIEEVEVAPPKANEVRIKIITSDLCHTDSHSTNPKFKESVFPVIFGHEGAGIVESIGPGVINFKPGDKVIPLYLPQCRKCKFCLSPLTNFCEKLSQVKNPVAEQELMQDKTSRITCKGKPIYHFMGVNTFSQYTVESDINLAKIDDDANKRVYLLGCGFSTGNRATINTAKVTPVSTCAILGQGGGGLSAITGCKVAGASRIIAIDINSERFTKVKALGATLGATNCLNPRDLKKPIQQIIIKLTDGGVGFALDCAGAYETMKVALECVTVGWGSCTFTDIVIGNKGLKISLLELTLGHTINGTFFGGGSEKWPPNEALHYNTILQLDLFCTHEGKWDEKMYVKAFVVLCQNKNLQKQCKISVQEKTDEAKPPVLSPVQKMMSRFQPHPLHIPLWLQPLRKRWRRNPLPCTLSYLALQPRQWDHHPIYRVGRFLSTPIQPWKRQETFAFEWEDPLSELKQQLCWAVLPQAFKNSPTLFGVVLAQELHQLTLTNRILVQYVANLLIAGKDEFDSLQNTTEVLNFLGNAGYRSCQAGLGVPSNRSIDSVQQLVTDYKNKKFNLDALVTHMFFDKISEASDLIHQGKKHPDSPALLKTAGTIWKTI